MVHALPKEKKAPQAPEQWTARGGSLPEWMVYLALLHTGRKEFVDFVYQAKFAGGRLTKGGAIADFLIYSPRMGINVQSVYYHARTANQRAHDRLQREMYEAQGIPMSYITEEQALENADHYVGLALTGQLYQGPLGI